MYIGIDIGGHKINSVLMRNNKIIRKRKAPTKSISNKEIMIAQIFDCIEYLMGKNVKGIGIGAPAPVNVTALKNVSLVEIVRKKFKIKTRVDNDANCFVLAEAMLGAGKDAGVVVGLTLGTGLGAGVAKDKKIIRNVTGNNQEFCHSIIVEKNGLECSCGNKGCIEQYVSVRATMRIAKQFGLKGKTPKDIGNMARKGNRKAIKVFQIVGNYLKIGLVDIIKRVNPDIIVIGGGIANNWKFIIKPVENVKVVRAKLGEDAGAIGAALLLKT